MIFFSPATKCFSQFAKKKKTFDRFSSRFQVNRPATTHCHLNYWCLTIIWYHSGGSPKKKVPEQNALIYSHPEIYLFHGLLLNEMILLNNKHHWDFNR